MYLIDLCKSITRKSNIPVFIYLFLNVIIISGIISAIFSLSFWLALPIGLGVYALSMVIALSPFGEWVLRLQSGCKKIKRQDVLNFIDPIFQKVYAEAKAKDPTINDNVQLYMNNNKSPNAFATGRKTICITEGLLQLPPVQIEATLAHEFGHLAHKDTDLILVVTVGDLIVSAIILGFRLIIDLIHLLFSGVSHMFGGTEGIAASIGTFLSHALMTAIVGGLTWIWTKIGELLVLKSSRSNEYEADEFASELGYGNALCATLNTIDDSHLEGLFATLASSHPDKDDRIARLQSLGATYGIHSTPVAVAEEQDK